MCSANTFSAAGATECSKCNELTEYAGMAYFFYHKNVVYQKDMSRIASSRPLIIFTVVCLVAWPLNGIEAGVDLVLIETSLLFLCKFLVISMRTASLA